MDELIDFILKPIVKLLLTIFRFTQFLAIDLLMANVGWPVGWVVCRLMTFGRWPKQRMSELEDCSVSKAIFVELIGILWLLMVLTSLVFILEVF